MIVVFDGYKVKDNLGTIYSRKDMEVVYTSSNLTADAYIERFVADHKKDYDITVASSDGFNSKCNLCTRCQAYVRKRII